MSEIRRRIGIIGTGKCGCAISNKFYQEGYKSAFIDTNMTDLMYLNVPSHIKYQIPKAMGCGGNREKSKLFIEMYYDDMVDFIEAALPNKEYYLFVTSQGRGSGAGAVPMLSHLLALKGHNVGIISVLPAEDEDILENSLGFLEETVDLSRPTLAHFMFDNNYGNKDMVNNSIVTKFNELFDIAETYSEIDSIDFADILASIGHKGYAAISSFVTANEKSSIKESFYNSLKDNISPSPQWDRNIGRLLISYGYPKDHGLTNDLVDELANSKIKKHENFTNRQGKTITLLTGLSYPFSRVQRIKDILKQNNNCKKNVQQNFDFTVEGSNSSSGIESVKSQPKVDLKDIFAQYRKK